MARVRLIDFMGFNLGEPEVPEPLPRVIVWGEDFFLIDPEDHKQKAELPKYRMTTGFVLNDTREA